MASLLRMPEVAANATEAVLQDWTVAEHVSFDAEEAIAVVETEKAVVDVEADEPGVILKQLVAPGAQVEVGAPIALLGNPGEEVEDVDAVLAELGLVAETPVGASVQPPVQPPAEASAEPSAEPSAESSGDTAVVAPGRRTVPDDPEGGTADTGGSDRHAISAAAGEQRANLVQQAPGRENGRIFSSPLARRLAHGAGLRLEEISGTGPRGRITRRDVEEAVASRTDSDGRAVAPSPSPVGAGRPDAGTSVPHTPGAGTSGAASYTEVPHTRMRRAIASRLSESKQQTPHFYLRGTARVDKLLELRAALNEDAEVKVSVNDLVVKAVARAHVLVPRMNVTWTDDALRQYGGVDLSVAVATDEGLLTPVLRGVDTMSVTAVGEATRDLAARARAKKLRQEELQGGSCTVTNLGMYGTEEFAAIINPPQSAILAVGAARREVVAGKNRPKVAQVMSVTLSVDHRAVDGAHAAEWMRAFLRLLERPVKILA
jgi:pyruvate dehydrogenase E2 component (dihydrolipoamide acetyltransferase)